MLVAGLVKAYGDRMKLVQAKYTVNATATITTGQEGREAEIEGNRNPTNWLSV